MKAGLIALGVLLPSAALAQSAGCLEPAVMHGRLAVVPYRSATLYECILSPDIATTIVAAGGETVGPVGAADPVALDIAKTANMVIVQPKQAEINRSPNMTFETKTAEGVVRPYFFLFHVAGYGGVPAIQLAYPEDEAKAKREAAAAQGQAYPTREASAVASTLRTAPFYSPRPGGMNWKYSCMCDSWTRARPDISDNGLDTIVTFPGSTPTDIVISRLDRDGTEKPGELPHRATVVNFTPLSTGGPLIIPDVAEYWRFVSGNQIAATRNDWYHPEMVDVRSGSQSPAVVRKITPTPQPPQRQQTAPQRPETAAK